MDFDVSTPSVTEALGDLQLRLQSVREDAELFSSLEQKAAGSFEQHRAELTLLLQKERAVHAAAEDRLRDELQRLLQENERVAAEIAAVRERRERCCREEARARQLKSAEREEELRRELEELRERLRTARGDADAAQREKIWHELQLREMLERQRDLNDDMQRLRRELDERQAQEEREACVQERRLRRMGACGGLEKVFLPAGLPDELHSTSPASHHITAIVSTVERQNCYKPRMYYRRRGIISPMDRRLATPPRYCSSGANVSVSVSGGGGALSSESHAVPLLRACAPLATLPQRDPTAGVSASSSLHHAGESSSMTRVDTPSRCSVTKSGRHLAALCRSLLREILAMRREYEECSSLLNDPAADSVELSRRMRNIMSDLDRKVHQLRSLRHQQAKVEDKLKLHDMMMEIATENNYCESIYSDLIELIRS